MKKCFEVPKEDSDEMLSVIGSVLNYRNLDFHLAEYSFYGRVSKDFPSMPSISRGNILEIGCSFGETTKEISGLYPNCSLHSVDLLPERVRIAKKNNPHVHFYLGNAFDSQSFNRSFDAVFCMNNLYHELSRDAKMSREHAYSAGKLVKDMGYLFVSGDTNSVIYKKEEGFQKVHIKWNENKLDLLEKLTSAISSK